MLVRTRLHAARKFSILFLLTFLFLLAFLAAVMLSQTARGQALLR